MKIRSERDVSVGEQVDDVHQCRQSVCAAKEDDESVHRDGAEGVEQVGSKQEESEEKFAYSPWKDDTHEYVGVGLKYRLIKHEKRQLGDKERGFFGEDGGYGVVKKPIKKGQQSKTEQWNDYCPKEEAVMRIADSLRLVTSVEIREETDDGGGGAQLREADEKCACVNKHSCQPDFLGSEEPGQHEEGSQEADKDPQIGHNSALNALSGYDSQDKY